MVLTAEPGTASRDALHILASWNAGERSCGVRGECGDCGACEQRVIGLRPVGPREGV
jgi:hypothetical protein